MTSERQGTHHLVKRFVAPAAAIAITALTLSASGFAQADSRDCRPEKLDGLYVFSATGYTIVAGVAQPKAIIEMIRFNGDGTLTVPGVSRSANGQIFPMQAGSPGTYTVNADCTGALVFNPGPTFDTLASPSGDELWMNQTNATNVLQGRVSRVSP